MSVAQYIYDFILPNRHSQPHPSPCILPVKLTITTGRCGVYGDVPPIMVYFLRTCVLSGYSFLPIFLICVLSGMLFNLIVSYVFPQGIQSHAFWSYFMFSQGQGQVVRAAQPRQCWYPGTKLLMYMEENTVSLKNLRTLGYRIIGGFRVSKLIYSDTYSYQVGDIIRQHLSRKLSIVLLA